MRATSSMLLAVAAACMTLALFCQNVDLVSQDYRGVLLAALVCMAISDGCCAVVFRRGGNVRWASAIIASPSLFIILDFLRRAPSTWGLA